MRIGLFIPCFADAFFPEVGIATLESVPVKFIPIARILNGASA
jgi:hypothetical protein